MGTGELRTGRRVGAALKGKVVLLVSVAEDLGFELATPLAKCGCRIVLAGSTSSSSSSSSSSTELQTTSSNIKALGLETSEAVGTVELDVRAGEASVDAAVGRAWNIFGTIDVLIFCSTVPGAATSPLEHSESDWDEVMTVNLKAPWLVARAVAQRMRAAHQPRGSILFVSYLSGLERGFCPGVSVHGAALAGLHQLSKYMGMELGKYGIMVAAVARGWSKTNPMLVSSKLSEHEVEEAGKTMPLQRWTEPVQDLEGLVALLASDYGHYLTCNVFIADGGQSLVRPRMKSSL